MKVLVNVIVVAGALCIPLGAVLAFIFENGNWLALSAAALIFFMAG